jgi:hypothetical protein
MSSLLKYLIVAAAALILAGTALGNAGGVMEGHLKILAPKPVDIGDENAVATAANYADYPLLIVSRDEHKEIARVTADSDGNYRITLPPGDYVLDVQGRTSRHVRAKPQPFTVISNQTVHVDMEIYADHWRVRAAGQARSD